MLDLAQRISTETTLLLISKSGTDVSGSDEAFRARSESVFKNETFEIWGLHSGQRNIIHLDTDGKRNDVRLEESGFIVV